MTNKPKKGDTLKAQPLCLCPCGKLVGVSLPDAKEQFVVHAQPTCADFDSRDPVEFLRWIRQRDVS